MGTLKKAALVLGAVLGAAALIAPASASALEWTHNHKTLVGHATVALTGTVSVGTGAIGWLGCDVHATLTAEPPASGTVTTYEITTETCKGNGIYTNCIVVSDIPTVPWEVVLTANGIEITKATIHFEFENNGKCPVVKHTTTFPTIKVKTDNSKTISQVELEGKTEGASPLEIRGTMKVEPAATLGFV